MIRHARLNSQVKHQIYILFWFLLACVDGLSKSIIKLWVIDYYIILTPQKIIKISWIKDSRNQYWNYKHEDVAQMGERQTPTLQAIGSIPIVFLFVSFIFLDRIYYLQNITKFYSMAVAEQLKCKVHPSQYITNYCAKASCNIELCATCICEHTEFHNRTNTKPEYQNIKQTFLKTNQNLNKFKESLTKQKTRIKNIMDNIEKKRKQVQKTFKQAKEDVLALVERIFSELEKQFSESLIREKQKTGLLNQARLDELYAQINRRSLQVYSTTQQLNNMRQINNVKKVNSEFIPKGVQFRQEIAQQITYNEMFQPNVSYKSAYLEQVAGSLKRLISLSFSYPVKNQQRQHRNTMNQERTPNKDVGQQQMMQQTGMSNTFGRPSQMMVKSPVQMARSPGKLQSQTRTSAFCNFRTVGKQNNNGWGFSQDPMMKAFGNTFTN